MNEIAMIFVNSDGEPTFERDIRVYPLKPANHNQPLININILKYYYYLTWDPMLYPILYPFGEPE